MKLKSVILIIFAAAAIFAGCAGDTRTPVYIQVTEAETTDSTNYNVVSEKNILSEDFYFEDTYRACRQKVCDMIAEELLMADTNERQELNPFLAGKGVYVSQKAIYKFILDPKLREENTGTEFFTVPVFSEDMSAVCRADVSLYKDGRVSLYLSDGLLPCAQDDIINQPDTKFIYMLGHNGTIEFHMVISEDNEIYEWTTKVNFDIEVEGDPYHAMPYEDMAFSNNELTDESNLVWMGF